MDLVAGIAVQCHVMPCHDCGICSKHLCIVYHDACETIFCMLYNAVFVYLYQYGLWPEIKSYYYIIIILFLPAVVTKIICLSRVHSSRDSFCVLLRAQGHSMLTTGGKINTS